MSQLRILYRTGLYTYEIDGPHEAGMIATFTGNRVAAVCQPDQIPVGFFITSTSPFPGNTTGTVAIGQGEYQTDLFSQGHNGEDVEYKIRDLLYCSPQGLITTRKTLRRQPIVGIVNSVEDGFVGFVSCFSELESVGRGTPPHTL